LYITRHVKNEQKQLKLHYHNTLFGGIWEGSSGALPQGSHPPKTALSPLSKTAFFRLTVSFEKGRIPVMCHMIAPARAFLPKSPGLCVREDTGFCISITL
jgi:hypothetical protein